MRRKRPILILILSASALATCLIVFYPILPKIIGNAIRLSILGNDQFCMDTDSAYNQIRHQLPQWVEALKSTHALAVEQIEGSPYQLVVFTDWWDNTTNTQILVIRTTYAPGPTIPRFGLRGYIFTQDASLPPISPRYQFRYFHSHLYCYWLAGSEPPNR
ncbi:hypothetical protein ANRL4_02658 [Anaerolineae bacterium]|nr:hypothetical protein ANRL4_02658 [Anaerolineae bacterium]